MITDPDVTPKANMKCTPLSHLYGGIAFDGPHIQLRASRLACTLALSAILHPVFAPAATYPEVILESNPEAYWRLGDPEGSDFILDETLNHPLLAQFASGGELGATGSLELIGDFDPALNIAFRAQFRATEASPSPLLDATGPFSFEVWIKSALFGGTALANNQPLPSRGFSLHITDDGALNFRTGGSSDAAGEVWEDATGGQLLTGQWAHLVCSWDGTYKEVYLNGIRVAFQEAQILPAATSSFAIGGDFNGTLDELAFYRRALKAPEIIRHYEASGRPIEGILSIHTSASDPNSTTISWKGEGWILESSTDPLDENAFWESLPDAVSPFTLPIADGFRFFRLVRKPL